MKSRFLIKQPYPFQKYDTNSIVFPTKKEVIEFKKFNRIFEDITILFKILKFNDKGEIIRVKCLKSKNIYNIGDTVIYKLSHLKFHCAFKISGFQIPSNEYENFIYACFNSLEHQKSKAQACGVSILEHLTDVTKYNEIKYLD